MTCGFAVGRACGCAGEDEGGFAVGFSYVLEGGCGWLLFFVGGGGGEGVFVLVCLLCFGFAVLGFCLDIL